MSWEEQLVVDCLIIVVIFRGTTSWINNIRNIIIQNKNVTRELIKKKFSHLWLPLIFTYTSIYYNQYYYLHIIYHYLLLSFVKDDLNIIICIFKHQHVKLKIVEENCIHKQLKLCRQDCWVLLSLLANIFTILSSVIN